MIRPLRTYTRWLHTRWPAGRVEPLPEVAEDGSTRVPGLFVAGDLTGIPLLKFAVDGGARLVDRIADEPAFARRRVDAAPWDLVIVGGGVAGMSAALAARARGLRTLVLEAAEPFATISNFPRGKPIFTYPTGMHPAGEIELRATAKEELLEELRRQTLERGVEPRIARVHAVERRAGLLEVVLAGGDGPEAGERIPCHRAIVAVGRSGDFRRLDVPGEEDGLVFNRLHDPGEFAGRTVVVVGGGDSAVEAAVALAAAGATTTLVHRGRDLARARPENAAALERARREGRVEVLLESRLRRIDGRTVRLDVAGAVRSLEADAVFALIGREPPAAFLRRCGIPMRGDWTAGRVAALLAFLAFCVFLYHWKTGTSELPLHAAFESRHWFPFNLGPLLAGFERIWAPLRTTLSVSLSGGGFYYTLAYALCVVVFGIRRIRRRRTPYITRQTLALMAIQCLPLFLLPELILPALGHAGAFGQRSQMRALDPSQRAALAAIVADAGEAPDPAAVISSLEGAGLLDRDRTVPAFEVLERTWPGLVLRTRDGSASMALDPVNGRVFLRDLAAPSPWIVDQLFPPCDYGHGREYWRSYGFVLAWPLFVYNFFTHQPLWLWLAIGTTQTFILIPLIVHRWGKGAYCGWICSCGALAETLGDGHRRKMPHGPGWNRLNMVGQAVLLFAALLMAARVAAWLAPESRAGALFDAFASGIPFLNYKWMVDIMLAGVLGVGLYFWFSGRVWCRFACPLAALMHVYARFSRFRIFADKKRCISCNVCTSVCHQGIDVMSFANKGLPMEDPQCVRCSACVQSCPTGVLAFGRLTVEGAPILDRVPASPVRIREMAGSGRA